jgi:ABC-type uncharacterized transport system YnjBCD permease subunit
MGLLGLLAMLFVSMGGPLIAVAFVLSAPLQILARNLRPKPDAANPMRGLVVSALLPVVVFVAGCAGLMLWLILDPPNPGFVGEGIFLPLGIVALAITGVVGNVAVSAWRTYQWWQARQAAQNRISPSQRAALERLRGPLRR